MKKIGIMSMQRVANYGSFLQGFALKKVVDDISGENVSFVDFHTSQGMAGHDKGSFSGRTKTRIKFCIYFLQYKLFGKKKLEKDIKAMSSYLRFDRLFNKRFKKEFHPILGIGQKKFDDGFDILIIGSDEVFNFISNENAGYSRELIGIGNKTKKIISYSACCGYTTIESLNKQNAVKIMSEGLDNFTTLSVRDQITKNLVYELTGKHAEYHLDPVLCYDYAGYIPEISYKRPYIAVYAHSGLDDVYKTSIEKFANKNGLEILCFMGYQGDFGTFIDATPFEVLAYIKNAEYVVTTTFHGCVFSIKYNKKFGVIVKYGKTDSYSNNGKVCDLLQRLQLSSREVYSSELLEQVLMSKCEYDFANDYIINTVNEGKAYLKKYLLEF